VKSTIAIPGCHSSLSLASSYYVADNSPLPDTPIGSLEEVPILDSVLEDVGSLGNVWVDPSADFYIIFLLEFRQVFLGVWERLGIPGEGTPIVSLHPASNQLVSCYKNKAGLQAIKMEDSDMTFPVTHTLEERRDGLLIVGRGE